MKKTWEQEKAYCAKRAQELGAEMDAAIENTDRERFDKAYTTAMRYMKNKERSGYYKRFLTKMREART